MQNQFKFKYIYNGQEVSKEEFEKLSEGTLKMFEGSSIVSVPFEFFNSFFNGNFKSKSEINDHLKSALEKDNSNNKTGHSTRLKANTPMGYNRLVEDNLEKQQSELNTEKKLQELKAEQNLKKCSPQCFCNDSCKNIVGDLECINRPPSKIIYEKKEESLNKYNKVIIPMGREFIEVEAFLTEEEQNKGIKETEGVKLNKNKPQLSLLFKQFPKALEAITKCSEYGHEKYKDTDSDYLNFKRVEGGSKAYEDAGLRHRLFKKGTTDIESQLPHAYHIAWNALAELELILENK